MNIPHWAGWPLLGFKPGINGSCTHFTYQSRLGCLVLSKSLSKGPSWLAYPNLYPELSSPAGWAALPCIIQPFWLPICLYLWPPGYCTRFSCSLPSLLTPLSSYGLGSCPLWMPLPLAMFSHICTMSRLLYHTEGQLYFLSPLSPPLPPFIRCLNSGPVSHVPFSLYVFFFPIHLMKGREGGRMGGGGEGRKKETKRK